MEPRLRTKLLTAVTLAFVFVSGGVTGYAAAVRGSDAAEPPPLSRRSYVYEQFHPDEAQRVRIDSILRSHRAGMRQFNAELEAIRHRYEMASDSIARATGDAIALVFPADIATEYLERLAERRLEQARAREESQGEPRGRSR